VKLRNCLTEKNHQLKNPSKHTMTWNFSNKHLMAYNAKHTQDHKVDFIHCRKRLPTPMTLS